MFYNKFYLNLKRTFSLKAMKTFIILSILSLIFVYPAKAQVTVTGHVTAEIMDAASVSSQSFYSHQIDRSPDFASEMDFDSFVLGEVTIHSSSDVACNVVLKPADISGSEGESLRVETSLAPAGNKEQKLSEIHHTDKDQTLQLTGDVSALREQRSDLYKGSYTVVFAYN